MRPGRPFIVGDFPPADHISARAIPQHRQQPLPAQLDGRRIPWISRDGIDVPELLGVLVRDVEIEDVGHQLPHVGVSRRLKGPPGEALVVVVQRVGLERHELHAQHQVVPGVHVGVVPQVHHVGLLAVDHQRADRGHGPRGGAVAHLVLPALLLGAANNPEGPDARADEVDQVLEAERAVLGKIVVLALRNDGRFHFMHIRAVIAPIRRRVGPVARVHVEEQLPPERFAVRGERHGHLQPRQQVVERGQIDQRVDRRAEVGRAARAGPAARAEHAVPVQAHHEGQIAVVDPVRQEEHVLAVGLGQVQLGHELLNPVGRVVLGAAGLVGALAVRVRLEVAEQRGVVVDPGVGGVVQRRGEPALRRERALVHNDVGEAGPVHVGENIRHSFRRPPRRLIYIQHLVRDRLLLTLWARVARR